MNYFITVIAIAVVATSICHGFPAPIPEPKQSIKDASRIVFEYHIKENPDASKSEPIVQKAEFSCYEYSQQLKEALPELSDKKQTSEIAWLRSEWGWIVTIVRSRDLSSHSLYFLRPSGEIVLLAEAI